MARIRLIEIANFRGIKGLTWAPSAGINCLIGPGDSCKSSILDAIDLCLGARRNVQITDADFHNLDVDQPLSISCTIGSLADRLKNFENYGLYLRNFLSETQTIEDEPGNPGETVLTVNLTVGSDLEPVWTLVSQRAVDQDQARNLSWGDRQAVAPTRIGALAEGALVWRRGSVLNKLSEEKADISSALVLAAREARSAFGTKAGIQLEATLATVKKAADALGIPVGGDVTAMLDAHSVSFSGGSISLHSETGIPLRGLGVGSMRLLSAGLQREAAKDAMIALVDELEYGLEPHRILRLLGSLGSKEPGQPLQVFATTHSPVAVRELAGDQLMMVRQLKGTITVDPVGVDDDVQAAVRLYPDALLAPSIIICEGASEVGLLRGLDLARVAAGKPSITALGAALIDVNGVSKIYKTANPLLKLGYRCLVLRDDDEQPKAADEEMFTANGGTVVMWPDNRKLESQLFLALTDSAVGKLLEYALELHGKERIDDHIKSKSNGTKSYADVDGELTFDELDLATREMLGEASSIKKSGWYKQVRWMEEAARDIIAPDLPNADVDLTETLDTLFAWVEA